jgi:predicted nucleic acid-binding protein
LMAVANSSVFIALSGIGQVELLLQRFPEGILIPQAVWREVVEAGRGQPGSEEVASASWITVCDVKDEALVSLLSMELDKGEAEAIALCCEQQGEIVLLDEKDARRVARRLGLSVGFWVGKSGFAKQRATLGTVGLLIWAKRIGRITSLREQLDALQTHGDFWLSQAVREKALHAVGETEQ